MVFSSSVFLFFFLPLTFIFYFNPLAARSRKLKNFVLLAMSLFFYAWGEPLFVFAMVFSAAVNWYLGLRLAAAKDQRRRRLWLTLAVVYDVSLLGIFKYLGFFTQNLAALTGYSGIVVKIALPIGISFFTFQMMSYIFDIASGKAEAQKSFLDVLLYVALFPQLIAGPIVRYADIEREIKERQENWDEFSLGMCRFVKGLAKKMLLANTFAILVKGVYGWEVERMAVATAWLGAVAYTLQIYYDFSGYSDMAIGLGRMFGFHFAENFHAPYTARSVSEFWRRWHISMGSWFRDYVYIPLGGSRMAEASGVYRNLFLVWLLTGLWHGANWTFIAWGLMYFILLAAEKRFRLDHNATVLGQAATLFFVIIGWTIFRAPNLSAAGQYIAAMLGLGGSGILCDMVTWDLFRQFWLFLAVGSYLCTAPRRYCPVAENLPSFAYVPIYVAMLLFSVGAVVRGGYNPFIYFNF